MAGDEHEPEEVVANVVLDRGLEVRRRLLDLEIPAKLLLLALRQCGPPEVVDGTPFPDGHEPGAGVAGHALLRPLLERCHQRLLGQVLGQPHVAHHPGQAGDQPRRLDPPDRVDDPAGIISGHAFFFSSSFSSLRALSIAGLSPNSSSSKIWRTSITGSPSNSSLASMGARLAHSMASSIDFAWMIQ